jgi:hypothetical protein
MLTLALIAAMFGIGTFTVRSARERGRSGPLWAALSIAAMLAGLVTEGMVLVHLSGDGTFVFSSLVTLVVPLACMAALLGLLFLLPEKIPQVAGARWPMHRLASRDQAAAEIELAFDGLALHVGDVTLQPADIRELVADGECLRIAWAGAGQATLMPAGKELRSARERMKRSQALERQLNALLRRNAAA